MIKYYALAGLPIKQHEVIRETSSYVYLPRSGRAAKRTASDGFFDTWQEARDFLLAVEEDKIAALTRELARRQENVKKIQEMKE